MAYRFQSPPRYSLAPAVPVQTLLGQVLSITALGLCITAAAAYLFHAAGNFGLGLVAMLIGFALLFAINATRNNPALSLTLFYIFAFLEGVGLAPVIGHYLQVAPQAVTEAALTTGIGMFGLAAIVYATGLDLRRFSGIVFGALIALVLVGIVSLFTHWVHPTVYSWLTLVIFSALVLIDFARIRAGGDGFTPVQLAVQIYLDAINIFIALLQIFGGRRRDD